MKNKKGNVAIIAIIIVIVAITAGVIGWLFAKKLQPLTEKMSQNNQTSPLQNNSNSLKTIGNGIVYKLGKNIIFYNPKDQQEKTILTNDKLIDFDISKDGKYLAYSLSEDGFAGNADIYFLDINNKKTTRLTEKNNIASLSPKIYSDGKKIA